MIYKTKEGEIELDKLTRLYPAVLIEMNNEKAEMSLEWAELYGEKVKLLAYILVFDFTKADEEQKNRVVLSFETKEELISEIQKVAPLLQN